MLHRITCQAALAALALLPLGALAAPFAYVPNEKSGSVSVIDTAQDVVLKRSKSASAREVSPSRPMAPACSSRIHRPVRW